MHLHIQRAHPCAPAPSPGRPPPEKGYASWGQRAWAHAAGGSRKLRLVVPGEQRTSALRALLGTRAISCGLNSLPSEPS